MEHEQTEKHRQSHQQRRKQHIDVVEQNGVKKAILFGSILQGNHFHPKSDLDLLVYDLPLQKWASTLAELEEIEDISDIEIDLKRAEELSENFLIFTEKVGRHIL